MTTLVQHRYSLTFLCVVALAALLLGVSCDTNDDASVDDTDDTSPVDDDNGGEPYTFTDVSIVSSGEEDEPLAAAVADALDLFGRVVGPGHALETEEVGDKPGLLSIVFEYRDNALWFAESEFDGIGPEGYAIRRAEGSSTVAIASVDTTGARNGLYRVLELARFRFFHPEQIYVPAGTSLSMPATVEMVESPPYARRGFHIHTMHPIEASEFLLKPGLQHLEWARHLIDWLARNRQNYVQWELLREVDYEATVPHFRAIVDYAHRRGVKVGIVTTWVFQQQKAWKIVPAFWCECRDKMEDNIDRLMAVPWDHLHFEMGTSEFTPTDPDLQIAWMNNTVAYLADNYPQTDASVKVHVSSNQYVDEYGVNFNFLPQFADERMGVYPHTVQFYDLLGPAPAYGNDSFRYMYDWMLDRVGERKVYFYPETAYWVSFDIDVPLFLPIYPMNRVKDIQLLADSGIDGHVTFSSGHEWMYWFNDWVTARSTFNPATSWPDIVREFTAIFGELREGLAHDITRLADDQEASLIDGEMISYITGQDTFDEINYLLGGSTQPKPVQFSEINEMDAAALADFEQDRLQNLGVMAWSANDRAAGVERLAGDVPDRAVPWYDELRDAFRVNALRINHSYELYAGAVARRRAELGIDPDGFDAAERHFAQALGLTEDYKKLMTRREAAYRYPLEYSTAWKRSVTSYDFRYLWQAHTAYWNRRAEKQAIEKQYSPFLMNVIDPIWFMF